MLYNNMIMTQYSGEVRIVDRLSLSYSDICLYVKLGGRISYDVRSENVRDNMW